MSYKHRINKVKNILSKNKLEGLYITNITNVRYLTGFTGSAGSVLIINNEQHFFTDGRYIEQSKSQVKDCIIHIVGSAHYKEIEKRNLIKDNLHVGFESDYVSVNLFSALSQSKPNVNW